MGWGEPVCLLARKEGWSILCCPRMSQRSLWKICSAKLGRSLALLIMETVLAGERAWISHVHTSHAHTHALVPLQLPNRTRAKFPLATGQAETPSLEIIKTQHLRIMLSSIDFRRAVGTHGLAHWRMEGNGRASRGLVRKNHTPECPLHLLQLSSVILIVNCF